MGIGIGIGLPFGGAPASVTTPPPGQVQNLTAVLDETNGDQLNVSWDAAAGADGYRLERSLSSGSGFTQIAEQAGTSFEDTGLDYSTQYFYRVRAYNVGGNGPYSDEANATTLTAPAAPTGLAAVQNGADADLAWTDNATNETEYRVHRATSEGGTYTLIDTIAAGSASYTDTAPGSGTWWYKVAAYNAAGEVLSGAASVVVYLLRVEFATDDAAPISNPYVGEVGSLTPVDTNNLLSVASGKLLHTAAAATSWTDPRIYDDTGITRACGLMFASIQRSTSTAFRDLAGFRNAKTGGAAAVVLANYFSPTGLNAWNGAATNIGVSLALNTDYQSRVICRTAGGWLILDDTLCWVYASGADTPLFASWQFEAVAGPNTSSDGWKIIQLPAPWNTDYGIATNRVVSPGNGETTTSVANAIIEVTITAVTGITQELSVRRTDDDNRWIVRMDQAGSTIKLIERNAAVETERASAAQTWVNGVAYRVVAIVIGDTILTFVTNVAKNTYASATFNNTATGVKISHAASNLIAWPRTLSGAALAALEAV